LFQAYIVKILHKDDDDYDNDDNDDNDNLPSGHGLFEGLG